MEKETDIPLVDGTDTVEILNDIVVPDKFFHRTKTGVAVLDEIFGGTDMPGILLGTSFLMTGMPGAGKSTICLQVADLLQRTAGKNILYNVGEENKHMIKMRATRINVIGKFCIAQKLQVDDLIDYCKESGVEVLFQDSLQSLRDGDLYGPRLLKSIVKKLHTFSKERDAIVFIVGHITKGGGFAGPKELQHDVDAHVHLRLNPDTGNRIMELQKNRFGPACMPYEFSLTAQGMDFTLVKGEDEDDGPKGRSVRASDRRTEVKDLIKERLLAGERISGYCFDRLKVDCSGGFWRGMLEKAAQELRSEGHVVDEARIDGRLHKFVNKKEV